MLLSLNITQVCSQQVGLKSINFALISHKISIDGSISPNNRLLPHDSAKSGRNSHPLLWSSANILPHATLRLLHTSCQVSYRPNSLTACPPKSSLERLTLGVQIWHLVRELNYDELYPRVDNNLWTSPHENACFLTPSNSSSHVSKLRGCPSEDCVGNLERRTTYWPSPQKYIFHWFYLEKYPNALLQFKHLLIHPTSCRRTIYSQQRPGFSLSYSFFSPQIPQLPHPKSLLLSPCSRKMTLKPHPPYQSSMVPQTDHTMTLGTLLLSFSSSAHLIPEA